MTKTKKQLRAEAVERLKNCVAARFDAESIVIALTSGRHGQSDWSLECDKLIELLTDDDANDDSTPESGVSDPDGGSNVAYIAPDSREKLEADVRKHYAYTTTTLMYPPSANKSTDMLGALPVDTVIGWLDRQEAITAEETSNAWEEYRDATQREIAELTAERNELMLKLAGKPKCEVCDRTTMLTEIEGLTAERDEIAELVGWHGEADGNSGRPLLVPMVAAMCEGSDVAAKLQEQVDELTADVKRWADAANSQRLVAMEQADKVQELTAERDKLKELNGYHAAQYELASEDCDRLQAQVDELTNAGRKMSTELANMQNYTTKVRAEREHYREKCSKMATIIHDALMVMDEGMA